MNEFLEKLLDLFFPPRCPFCRALLKEHEKLLCRKCRETLPWTAGDERRQGLRHIGACVSPLYYEGGVRRSLLRYKFGGMSVYAPGYAALMGKSIEDCALAFDMVTWAPLGRMRLKKRGYDQARLLAEAIAAHFEKPCVRTLVKTADNPPQSGTGSPEKRRANVAGVYRALPGTGLEGKSVLLVDDIVTTGATLEECARVLCSAGAKQICAATLARGRKK